MAANGARAVLFDYYGARDALCVADVPMPTPAAGEVVVAVRAAGISPGEGSHPIWCTARQISRHLPVRGGE
jgi:hypothetical protein